jgi:syntaxin 16
VPKFDDEENKKLDKEIKMIVIYMTKQLKNCESKIKELINEQTESSIEEQMKINMKQNLYTKMMEFTRQFKTNEEIYLKKYREISGEDYNLMNSELSRDKIQEAPKKMNFLQTEEENNDILAQRDNELTGLLTSINDLAQIFKDLQVLVLEQGTILDRIDYNIDTAQVNVSDGKKNLEKANKHMKKNCARNANLVLLVVDFILGLMLIWKFV